MSVHPAAWIAWAAGAGIVALSTTNPLYLVPLLTVAWFVYAMQGRTGTSARSFRALLVIGTIALLARTGLVLLDTVDASTVAFSFLEGLRLAALLVVFGTYNAVADPFGVLRLAPRRFHEPALAAALALSIAPRTIDSAAAVREAQRVRGIEVGGWRAVPALALPVLETGMESAVALAESMDSRGHGRGRRSRYRQQPWTIASAATAGAAAVAATMFVGSAVMGAGGLVPSTFPLSWPSASVALVAAVCVLAVPGLMGRGDTT
jgi:energy-coupling factor transport system permease protein